jgi:SOS-response transcriptional repressor LexA
MDKVQPTRKQLYFYDFICHYKAHFGILPTYREIQAELGYKSPHSVTQNIQSLIKKGWLRKEDNGAYVTVVQR